jgi:MFS family permease
VKAVANALLESAWMAVVAEAIPTQRRASVNGMRWTILSVVTAIASAGFGYVLERLAFPFNYQVVFFISFLGGSLGMLFWGKMHLPERPPFKNERPVALPVSQRLRSYWRSLQVPAFLRYELTVNVLRLGLNLSVALYSIYWIRQLNAADLWIGWRATANQIALIIGYSFWGKVVSRRGYFIPLLICAAGSGLAPVLTAFIPGPAWLPVVAVIEGLFLTGINLSVFDTLLEVCPADRRPSFFAVNTMLASLMIFLGPITGSFLADYVGIRGVFFITGGVHIVAMGLFWRFRIAADMPEAAQEQGSPVSS